MIDERLQPLVTKKNHLIQDAHNHEAAAARCYEDASNIELQLARALKDRIHYVSAYSCAKKADLMVRVKDISEEFLDAFGVDISTYL